MSPNRAGAPPLPRRSFLLAAVGVGLLACSGGTATDLETPEGGGGAGGSGGFGGSDADGGETAGLGGQAGAAGSDANDAGEPVECSTAAGTITIVRNHGHRLTIPREDVEAGVETSYDIMGTAAHPHTLVLTAADLGALARGEMLTLTTSVDADHDHDVIIECG